jgi:RNA polymerase-binding transcription factor DksA
MSSDSSFSLAVLEAFERDLGGVESVIETMQNNTFGSCVECATVIDRDALRADPVLVRCYQHVLTA